MTILLIIYCVISHILFILNELGHGYGKYIIVSKTITTITYDYFLCQFLFVLFKSGVNCIKYIIRVLKCNILYIII